ncbi:MAG TPA: alkaline phosphatase family protein [Pyrinomonadaceae bacterium]
MLIGLDGATFTILDYLMAEGVMPFLNDFISRGVRARLVSTPNALTPPAWTSMVTGRMPGDHGIFDFIHAEESAEGFYFTLNMSYDVRCETIWSIVSRAGGTAAYLNFPVSYPPEPINGYCVPGFVHWKHLRQAVHPPDFYDTLKLIPGFNAKDLSMDMNEELKSIQTLPPDEYENWIAYHIRREGQWANILRHLFTHSPADLTAVVFDGVDKLQHLCWRFLDPQLRPDGANSWESKIIDLCRDYFRQLDEHIREIVRLAGPDARIFMASDHGFGATSEIFYANVWLEREGYLSWNEQGPHDEEGKISADRIKSHVVGIDWNKTLAYALTPSSNGIYIRRAGRADRPGVPDEEYESFRRQLAAKLLAIKHPETGAPFVKRVMTREEAFPGDAAQRAPDLTLVLEDYGFLSVLNADAVIKSRPEIAGTHQPWGVCMAGGAGIASGRSLDDAQIIDVAPTLLHSLGLPVPADMEGRVLTECYEEGALKELPVTYSEANSSPERAVERAPAAPATAAEDVERERVLAGLKALGYIE